MMRKETGRVLRDGATVGVSGDVEAADVLEKSSF